MFTKKQVCSKLDIDHAEKQVRSPVFSSKLEEEQGKMRKNNRKFAGFLAALCVSSAAVSGCTQYDKIDLGDVAVEETAKETEVQEPAAEETTENQPGISALETELAQAPAPNFTEVSDTVYIRGNQVRLRTSPSTANANNISAVLNNGTALTRTGDSDDWCRVSYNGATLYVSKRYVTAQQPTANASVGNSGSGNVSASGSTENAGAGSTGNAAASGTTNSTLADGSSITVNSSWQFAEFSMIKTGAATLYRSTAENRKGITVCVNAGHGTNGGGNVKTLCHPDGSAKVTGGSTGAGAVKAIAVSSGMTFKDGTPERDVTLALAKALKPKLLAAGYDVVMIRESDDVQLDNIARTVIANNTADCHIALHWDSSESDKGAFYMSVPNVASYRAMEPVASNWQKHNRLGENLISGLRGAGVKIFSGGSMEMDLTQTSYSTVPSVDIELGDKVSDHSAGTIEVLANGLLAGINSFFGQ